VLSAPLGMSRLLGLLGDQAEALRNDALLLAAALARGSPDLAQLAAFEGAFDRLFAIIE
jgi:predicted nucleic acid-binding protein